MDWHNHWCLQEMTAQSELLWLEEKVMVSMWLYPTKIKCCDKLVHSTVHFNWNNFVLFIKAQMFLLVGQVSQWITLRFDLWPLHLIFGCWHMQQKEINIKLYQRFSEGSRTCLPALGPAFNVHAPLKSLNVAAFHSVSQNRLNPSTSQYHQALLL